MLVLEGIMRLPGKKGGFRVSGGHTILELVTVLALIAVASALAYPALAGFRRGQEIESAAVELLHAMRLARWRAVTSGHRVRLVPWQDEVALWRYRLERAEGAAWVQDAEERAIPRSARFSVVGPAAKIFNPDGTCSSGSLTLQAAGGATFRLTLTPATGRVRFYRGEREVGRAG